jgi:acetylglutamate kinase
MDKLTIIKIGGKVIDKAPELSTVLQAMADIDGQKILVHGGGSLASRMEETLGLVPEMVNGRRVTSKESLDVVTMVYGGLINKKIVANLQQHGANAMGLSGADGNIIRTKKRPAQPIDFGFVGDVEEVNSPMLNNLLKLGLLPVISAITHDGMGQLLNTNADTMAAAIAKAMVATHQVELVLAFEKPGVLDGSGQIVPEIDKELYHQLLDENIIVDGMIPKLDNAFAAIEKGVASVKLVSSQYLVEPHIAHTKVIKS